MILQVNTHMGNYPIIIKRNALSRADEYLKLAGRRVCIVTDTGVPAHYATTIADLCDHPVLFRFPEGESSKTMDTLQDLLRLLLRHGFDRADAIVAVGGGVVTDLAGFAAAIYMRGIDFYNVPTTLLSMVDASVGGKTAVDFEGYKNIIGAFWQPRAVVIDPETLNTLPHRRLSDGLSEVIKMALTSDAALFEMLEQTPLLPDEGEAVSDAMDEIITRALRIKIDVVEQDARERGLRRVLNFGHTLGHALESCTGLSSLYHGECVALGMIPMCQGLTRERLVALLARNGLPTEVQLPPREQILAALTHDKKADGGAIHAVLVPHVGEFCMQTETPEALADRLYATFEGKE